MDVALRAKLDANRGLLETARALVDVPVSMEQLRRALPGVHVVLYDEIPEMPLDEWLRSAPDRGAIMLYRWTDRYGHFVAVTLDDAGSVNLFDSMAGGPDSLRDRLDPAVASELGQGSLRLLKDIRLMTPAAQKKARYQDQRVQASRSETCGRWCALRVVFREFDEDEFTRSVHETARAFGMTPDVMVVLLTLAQPRP